MQQWFRLLALLTALGAGSAVAQEARVRTVEKVTMPVAVDSNSPAFWRDNKLFWFGSHGRPWLNQAPGLFGPWETSDVEFISPDACPHWMESVWVDDDGTMFGWYHAEPVGLIADSTMTAPKIGAVISNDGGKTLRDVGTVLESGEPLNPSAQNGYFAGGHGDFSVILNRDRTYFYFFYDNYAGPAETQGVGIARMAFEDRFTPAGRVWKFANGQWTESGIAGRVAPIFPVRRPWQLSDPDAFWGPSVHWNTYLKCYVMLLNHAQGEPGWSQEGVYVSFCSDLSQPATWTTPVRILDKSQFSGWYFFYPQVMGLESGGTDTIAGRTARLYVNGISKWEIDFIAKDETQAATEAPTPTPPAVVTPPPEPPVPVNPEPPTTPTPEPPTTPTPEPPATATPAPPTTATPEPPTTVTPEPGAAPGETSPPSAPPATTVPGEPAPAPGSGPTPPPAAEPTTPPEGSETPVVTTAVPPPTSVPVNSSPEP
jgi:hypothetical protein